MAEYGERFLPLYDVDWRTGSWRHPADQPPAGLFDLAAPLQDSGPVPYRAYLEQAHALARSLEAPQERSIPAAVPGELVFFSY